MTERGVVHREDAPVGRADNEHRDGIGVEQQTEGRLAGLDVGDVDAQPDKAAVRGPSFVDQDPAAIGQLLFNLALWIAHPLHALVEPRCLASGGFGIFAAFNADPQRVFQPDASLKQIGAAAVNVGVRLVPEDIAPVRVEQHDALGQHVKRLRARRCVRPTDVRRGGSARLQARPARAGEAAPENPAIIFSEKSRPPSRSPKNAGAAWPVNYYRNFAKIQIIRLQQVCSAPALIGHDCTIILQENYSLFVRVKRRS